MMDNQLLAALAWPTLYQSLDDRGFAVVEQLLPVDGCQELTGLYDKPEYFRSRIIMAKHGFGRGEYQYFGYPLPDYINQLRTSLYAGLVPIANAWNTVMKIDARFPPDHADFINTCRVAGQTKPTTLLLRYQQEDYNCLHQDIYGEHVFPFQVAFLLSDPEMDFTGGEFVITEQRPRMQSRVEVVPLKQGDAIIFAVRQRPRQGTRGSYRVNLRHGVSRIRSGCRHTLGIIFHDAI